MIKSLKTSPDIDFEKFTKIGIYSIYDRDADRFGAIFEALNDDLAKRRIIATIEQGENQINKFSQAFQLWKIGLKDEVTGELKQEKKKICEIDELKRKE